MDIYRINDIAELIDGNPYVGRGIVAGLSEDGRRAVAAYFIMGRSANSRNRIFAKRGGDLYTEPYDASKVEDPSLIIYAAVRETAGGLIVTNGDLTDTIYDGLSSGKTFEEALEARCFEPDAPNFTPRTFMASREAPAAASMMMIMISANIRCRFISCLTF